MLNLFLINPKLIINVLGIVESLEHRAPEENRRCQLNRLLPAPGFRLFLSPNLQKMTVNHQGKTDIPQHRKKTKSSGCSLALPYATKRNRNVHSIFLHRQIASHPQAEAVQNITDHDEKLLCDKLRCCW